MSFIETDNCFDSLTRCTKCLLPDSFPGISFDLDGVCNYCHDQPPVVVLGEKAFNDRLEPYRNSSKKYDCIVPISGGRDSSFVLFKMIDDFNMNPLTLTVDSGFITEEAYRNIDAVTNALDVDHVFLKDQKQIDAARTNSTLKFKGWLKNPNINTIVPVLNSGDKLMNLRMYNYAQKNGIKLVMGGNVYGNSTFEHEHFKTGFLGIFPDDRGRYTTWDKVQLMLYFGFDFISNSYNWNWSIFKEYLSGSFVYFFESLFKPSGVDGVGFYDYIKWNEKEIVDTVTSKLGWKGADDTTTTWRIDDSAYSLINYLYFYLAGFTEHDELFSKMIRDGQISREEAYSRCKADARPRERSLKLNFDELDVSFSFVHDSLQKYRKKIIHKYMQNTSFSKCMF